jgi:hypothetical protein
MKGRPCDRWQFAAFRIFVRIVDLFCGGGVLLRGIALTFAGWLQLRGVPSIGTQTIVLLWCCGMVRVPDPQVDIIRDLQCECLRKHDSRIRQEMLRTPELPRGFGLVADSPELVLNHVSRGERANGKLLLFQIAVERSLARHRRRHLDRVCCRCLDYASVRFADADVVDASRFMG